MSVSPTSDNLPPSEATPGPDHRADAPHWGPMRRAWEVVKYVARAEPALLRALVVAVLAGLVATGVVVPDGAESTATDLLGGLWAVGALVQGFATRAVVSPVASSGVVRVDSEGPGDA